MLEHLLNLDSYSIWLPSSGLTLILNAAWLVLLICVIASLIYRTGILLHDSDQEISIGVVNTSVFIALFSFFAIWQFNRVDFNEKLPFFWPAISPSYGCYQTILPTIYLLSTAWLESPVEASRQLLLH